MDNDGYISNGELFQVLKMMVGNNLKDTQLQQIVDKTICFADKDEDGKISFEEFCTVCSLASVYFLGFICSQFPSLLQVVGNTDIHKKMVVDVWQLVTSGQYFHWSFGGRRRRKDDMWMTSATYSLCAYIYFCDFCGWKSAAHILPVKTNNIQTTHNCNSIRDSVNFFVFCSFKSLH